MKFKKILSAAMASAVMLAGAASVSAIGDGEATYCFDTDAALGEWLTYGSVAETGFAVGIDPAKAANGKGSLVVSENSSGEAEDQFGGMYIEASALGLESFSGCKIEMSVMLCEGAEGFYDNLALYSDGMIWLTAPAENLSAETWTTVTLEIPENADNTKAGFTIPTFGACVRDIVYIDDFTITDVGGSVIANRGDYEVRTVSSEERVSTGTNIALTVALVVLILVIVGGIGFIVSSAIKKFS